MRSIILAAAAATLFFTPPSYAEPQPDDLSGKVHGTTTARAWGQVEVVSEGDQQLVKFDKNFKLTGEPAAQVRLLENSGKVTTLGPLASKRGAQTYVVPSQVTVGEQDHIVIYSPRYDENLATVNFIDD